MSAFRPAGSDIQVWVKFANGEDLDPITAKPWLPMISIAADMYSDPSNPYDMREFTFVVPKYYGMLSTNGTVTCTTSCTTITGVSTQFTTEVKNGWYINFLANSTFSETTRKITSITDDTTLTVDTPFTNNHTAEAYFIVPPPSTPYLAKDTTTQLTGTVTTSTTNNIVTGVGTDFVNQLSRGQVIKAGNDSQHIAYITNSTSLAVSTPWTTAVSGNNYYLVTSPGVTYTNDQGNQYTGFKRFQIKIILQADDTSRVPLVDDVRALALQM